MTHEVMNAVQAVANMHSFKDYQHIVMSRVARDALLRGTELINLQVGEITWNQDRTTTTIAINYSKSHKRVHQPERVIIKDYGLTSGTAFLRHYFHIMELDQRGPAYPLWPWVDEHGIAHWHRKTPKDKFIEHARALLKKAGYDSQRFAGHSYRSGGATDLWDSQKCRPLTLKLHGRWKSDAYRLYIRDNPHKTAQEIADALAFFDYATSSKDGEPAMPPSSHK